MSEMIAILTRETGAAETLGGEPKGWVLLIPAGKFSARDGRGPFVAGVRADMETIVARTRAYHGATEILVDYDHQSVFAAKNGVGGTAKAAGWLKQLEVRNDGIYGRIEWTAAARAAIRAGEYRYLSPVIPSRKSDGRILMILNVALTNSPAVDLETVAASASFNQTTVAALSRLGVTMDGQAHTNKLEQAAALLGLEAGADGSAVAARLRELLGIAKGIPELANALSAQPDPAAFVPLAVFQQTVAEMNKLRQGVTREAAERHVGDHIKSGKLAPFMKDWAVDLCTTNMPAFDAFVGNVGAAFQQMITPQLGATAKGPAGKPQLTGTELTVCSNLGLTADEFAKAQQDSAALVLG